MSVAAPRAVQGWFSKSKPAEALPAKIKSFYKESLAKLTAPAATRKIKAAGLNATKLQKVMQFELEEVFAKYFTRETASNNAKAVCDIMVQEDYIKNLALEALRAAHGRFSTAYISVVSGFTLTPNSLIKKSCVDALQSMQPIQYSLSLNPKK